MAWADLFLGSALLIGGAITLILGFHAVGGVSSFFEHNADKLHVILPSDHPVLPWTALVIGLWIPNLYYWGLNQYITQRTLAAKTLRQGQLGVIFAAIAGAIISSLASMLNSASTIFTMDLYKRRWKKDASDRSLIVTGRIMTLVFVVTGCAIAPNLNHPGLQGIFTYIQEFQGFISPGILAALIVNPILYAILLVFYGNLPVFNELGLTLGRIAFLNRMAITFIVIILFMGLLTLIKPLKAPKTMPVRKDFDMKPTPQVVWLGITVIVLTVVLYIIFW